MLLEVIVKHNEIEIKSCLSSIVKSNFSDPYEIIVVDNFANANCNVSVKNMILIFPIRETR